jgi:hypothetical protein
MEKTLISYVAAIIFIYIVYLSIWKLQKRSKTVSGGVEIISAQTDLRAVQFSLRVRNARISLLLSILRDAYIIKKILTVARGPVVGVALIMATGCLIVKARKTVPMRLAQLRRHKNLINGVRETRGSLRGAFRV